MIQIGNILVSLDIIDHYFICDLEKCKGQCCIDGDAGAPITKEEKDDIDFHIKEILPHLTPQGRLSIETEGTGYIDEEGDLVTTLIGGTCCAYSIFDENGTCLCALEKGFNEGKLKMMKPSSCHLYPIRMKKFGDITALNYHRWNICKYAEKKGRQANVRVYEFLKGPLIRFFGKEWYEELEVVAKEWLKQNSSL